MIDWNLDKSWTLFLDRDGVINVRKFGGYIESIEEFEFLPNVPEAIAILSKYFARIVVVTNQQGIGKGIMSERNLFSIHDYMCQKIEAKGGKIAACYFAPELKTAESINRKPNPGMALQAKQQFAEIDFNKSIMVGDTDSDIQFGINLGMKTVRVLTEENVGTKSDLSVHSLMELAKELEK